MDEHELRQVADDAATSRPGVTFEHRENPNWETYKVGGKVFLLMTDMPGHAVVTVKADPDEALALREQYEEITVGYHTDKRHWVSAAAGPGIDQNLVRGLVNDSYDLVVDKLPKSVRLAVAATSSGADPES
jgi:predicted DNA-binding protein (MmcQ/YjbR family)